MNATGVSSYGEGSTSPVEARGWSAASPPTSTDLKNASSPALETSARRLEESAPLRNFVLRARSAGDLSTLLGTVMEFAPLVSGAAACAVAIQTSTRVEVRLTGAPDRLIGRYFDYTATRVDPLHSALASAHGVARSNELFAAAEWQQHSLHREVLMPFEINAVMVGEIPDAMALRGAIAVGRTVGHHPFSNADALRLLSLCLHTSIAFVRIAQQVQQSHLWEQLSLKQQRLAAMVADGLTNDQIASSCGVTIYAVKKSLERLFARFSVSSRTELIATLGVPVSDSQRELILSRRSPT